MELHKQPSFQLLRRDLGEVLKAESGFYLIDKPIALTSHDVVDVVRRLTRIKRVGHTGTLDPLATGLLIILIEKAWTKRQGEFLKLDKTYRCRAQLGVTTSSYDMTGEVMATAPWSTVQALPDDQLTQTLLAFTGSSTQTVPPVSAVKIAGQKLYELSRQHQELPPLPQRQVHIHAITVEAIHRLSENSTILVDFVVSCSSGTYIRSLVHDWGVALGVGASVVALRRLAVGPYRVEQALNFTPTFWPSLDVVVDR